MGELHACMVPYPDATCFIACKFAENEKERERDRDGRNGNTYDSELIKIRARGAVYHDQPLFVVMGFMVGLNRE